MTRIYLVLIIFSCAFLANADIYMHGAKGSNNRYREANVNAQNQNRLFDSQNNAKGGYHWSPTMTYYTGSLLQLEWTSQHGCGEGHPFVDCNVVIQYMCGPWVTDGNNINTINPDDADPQEGHHEPQEYYRDCQRRQRNLNLFIANNNLGQPATRTRQNNNGNRYGTECPEEKDYWPYWHPTPWRDIAILTSDTSRCGYYKENSQNVADKYHCVDPSKTTTFDPSVTATHRSLWGRYPTENLINDQYVPNHREECESRGFKWEKVPSWGISPPECLASELARDNHLGNSYIYGKLMTNVYNWYIPSHLADDLSVESEKQYGSCIIRIRYNISTEDWAPWGELHGENQVDATYNEEYQGQRNDPTVTYGYDTEGNPRNLTLSVNYDQFGRTFQDRSHVIYIRRRPSFVPPTALIYNLNVRGRRGNIVQAYPAVESDFTKQFLKINIDDYLHIQWTGSDDNPANQAGRGKDRTERHNIVPIKDNNGRKNWPEDIMNQKLFDVSTAYQLAHLGQPEYCESIDQTGCCLTLEQLREKHNNNNNNIEQDDQNCAYLNAAPQHFSVITKPRSTGVFYYMCTRNNNFSNRSQKGELEVKLKLEPVAIGGVVAGSVGFAAAAVIAFGVWYAKSHSDSSAGRFFQKIKV